MVAVFALDTSSSPASPARSTPVVRPGAAVRESEASTTLSVSAGAAYEIFSDAIEIPRWLPLVRNALLSELERLPMKQAHKLGVLLVIVKARSGELTDAREVNYLQRHGGGDFRELICEHE